ncbi:hypothetical protein JTE90_019340 [Oedothorax gibbosus]|uniref:Uncharacterized protein n=1 Tax=Oedothorax gibbosus TaxID=931172 RepID=A0AAV6UNA6_9ARAC|nr:hypothetical protein JTE90_019340 [Oedothorax gibbosus]
MEDYLESAFIFHSWISSSMSFQNDSQKSQMINVKNFLKLLPVNSYFDEDFETSVVEGSKMYDSDLSCFQALKGELEIWKQMWDGQKKLLKPPAEAIKYAQDLPNI